MSAPPSDTTTAGPDTQTQRPSSSSSDDQSLFASAQRGDVAQIDRLVSSGQASVNDRDEQNITALHWAAINAQLAACRYLLERGAEVDARGGELDATPLMWAARNGHLYILHLLISYGADPSLVDSQGFNSLHLTTHSSIIMAVLYLLHQPVAIDAPDVQGHTALMWAAYQGDALSVDVLIRHGASVHKSDHAGLTPLHWATVRGNRVCLRHVIEAGADLAAKSHEGKTAAAMAEELKSVGAYRRALADCGLQEDGRRKERPLSPRNTNIAIFCLPTLFLAVIFWTLASLPSYTGVPLAFAEFYAMHHVVTRVLLDVRGRHDEMTKSPYFASIIVGSLVWVAFSWFTRLVYHTPGHAIANIVFVLAFLTCAWNFVRAMTLDPGKVHRPETDTEVKGQIEELVSQGRFNGQTYCIYTMAKKPLRSKHCRVTNRLVARFDHYCPWVWNTIGANNHRQFVVFVAALVVGVIAFDLLVYAYFAGAPALPLDPTNPAADPSSACLLPGPLCFASTYDGFLFCVSFWASLQLTWTTVILLTQLWQVARQMTTLEISNLGRYGYMGGRGTSAADQLGFVQRQQAQLTGGGGAGPGPSGAMEDGPPSGAVSPVGHDRGPVPHAHKHAHAGGMSFLLQILGLDRFTKGKAADGLMRHAANPFDLGFFRNCMDFWTNGRELGVDWRTLYDLPPEGFRAVVERRRREKGKGAAGKGDGRGGYERVGMEEV